MAHLIKRFTGQDGAEQFHVFRKGADLSDRRASRALFSDYQGAANYIAMVEQQEKDKRTQRKWLR